MYINIIYIDLRFQCI